MPRSDEAEAFFHAVYNAVQEIPPGKVTSYGHIAQLIGTREFLYQNDIALRFHRSTTSLREHNIIELIADFDYSSTAAPSRHLSQAFAHK